MTIYNYLSEVCERQADASKAKKMKAYMKNQFDFFGISSPDRKVLVKELRSINKIECDVVLWELVEQLWLDPHREMQYIALDLLTPLAKKMDCTQLPVLESKILSKSWWDTVDGIVPGIVGNIFQRNHACRDSYIYKWMKSENIWCV